MGGASRRPPPGGKAAAAAVVERMGVARCARPAITEPQTTEALMAAGNHRLVAEDCVDSAMAEAGSSGGGGGGDGAMEEEEEGVDHEMEAQAAWAACDGGRNKRRHLQA